MVSGGEKPMFLLTSDKKLLVETWIRLEEMDIYFTQFYGQYFNEVKECRRLYLVERRWWGGDDEGIWEGV